MAENKEENVADIAEEVVDPILTVYETLFKDRYSEMDEVFAKYLTKPKNPPPTVKNWFPKQNRNFDRNRGGWRGRGRGQGGHRDNYNRNYGDRRNEYHHHQRGHYRHQGHRDYHGNRGYHGDQRQDRRYNPY